MTSTTPDPITYPGTPIDEADVRTYYIDQAEGLDAFPIPTTPATDEHPRATRIASGDLVPVPRSISAEAGINVPVAVTREVWEECVAWTDEDNERQATIQDQAGRLWDLIYMAHRSMTGRGLWFQGPATFPLWRVPRDGRTQEPDETRLEWVVEPGDRGEDVMTIRHPQTGD